MHLCWSYSIKKWFERIMWTLLSLITVTSHQHISKDLVWSTPIKNEGTIIFVSHRNTLVCWQNATLVGRTLTAHTATSALLCLLTFHWWQHICIFTRPQVNREDVTKWLMCISECFGFSPGGLSRCQSKEKGAEDTDVFIRHPDFIHFKTQT